MKNKKAQRITTAVGALVFLSIFSLNVSLFVKSSTSNASLNTVFSAAAAEDESGDSGGTLKWSAETSCPGQGNGTYNVCNSNGTGSSCSPAGSTTCTCGTNCN